MNREQIIEMAREAGMFEPGPLSQDSGRWYPRDFAERFYALAYAAGQRDMRERAAGVCEDRAAYYDQGDDDGPESRRGRGARACATAIRAQPIGEKE